MEDRLKYSDVCGLFGKMPQQADFVNLHLTESLTQSWHQWVANGMSISQEQIGESWLDYYLTSPVWHFVLSPGALADAGIAGTMIPCVDSIGRYFPLTVGAMGHFNLWQATTQSQQWFTTLETFLLSILDEQLDYAGLVTALERLALPNFFSYCQYRAAKSAKEMTTTLGISAAEHPNPIDQAQRLFNLLTQQFSASACLWWTKGSDHVAATMRITDGMPDAGQFAALLDGQWAQWGWIEAETLSIESIND